MFSGSLGSSLATPPVTQRTWRSRISQYRAARQYRAAKRAERVRTARRLVTGPYTGRLLQRMPATGFPEMLEVKLRYNLFRSYNCGGTGRDIYQFKINSVFDPDLTSTGHQPLYRDQLYTIYKYAVVTGCRWSVECATQAGSGVIFIPHVSTYSTTDTDVSAAIERGGTKRSFAQIGKPCTMTGYTSMASLFGLPDPRSLLTDDLYRHDDSADPSQLAYLTIYTQDTESTTARCHQSITLDMTVVFKEVLKIAQS